MGNLCRGSCDESHDQPQPQQQQQPVSEMAMRLDGGAAQADDAAEEADSVSIPHRLDPTQIAAWIPRRQDPDRRLDPAPPRSRSPPGSQMVEGCAAMIPNHFVVSLRAAAPPNVTF